MAIVSISVCPHCDRNGGCVLLSCRNHADERGQDGVCRLSRRADAARRQVARIVGRDTGSLDEQEIKTAALETLAENLSDGVIAPMFWYLLLGLRE